MQCPQRRFQGQGVSDPPGTGATDDCEPACGCWESNPGLLEDQPVPLTAEPGLQALIVIV